MAQLTNTVLNGKLVVNGNIHGNLIGNASTATSAANAVSLNGKAESALSVSYATTASTATNATLANSATKIATTAAVSTSTYVLLGVVSSTAVQTPVRTGIEIIGTNINACTYTLNVGTIKGNYEVEGAVEQATYAVSAGYAGYALKLNNGSSDLSVGSSFRPVYFINGVPVATSTTLEVSITGNAATATKAVSLGTNAGSTTLPVYFSGGKPVATSTTLAISITGNASTASNASSLNGKAESALSVSHASTATSATSATSAASATYASRVVTTSKRTGSYHLTMVSASTSDTDGADIFVSNSKALTYNVSTGVVSATTFSGSLSGTATKAGGLSASAGSSSVPVYFNASGNATSVTSISKGLIPTDFFPQKIQTQYQANTNFYGASYPIYAKWVTPAIAKWLVDDYHTAAEYSQALIDVSYNTVSVGSTTRPVYFSGGIPVQTSTTLGVSITGNAATATQATSANYATSLKVQNYTTSPGYLLAAVNATGASLPIYSNTNIVYYPSLSTLKTPSISVNNIIHTDGDDIDLIIGNSSNNNFVKFVEDVIVQSAFKVQDEATFDGEVYMNSNVYINDRLPVLNDSNIGYAINVLSSTEFAALQNKSTSVIYFITP